MVHRFALLFVCAAAAALSAQAPEVSVLPVTKVVLYKSGVGYFEHLASVTGNQSLAVQFTADQLDDVLKSLTALDLGNGRVSGISYDSPTPAERRLRALRVPLAPDASALQVLQALRGARVEIRTGSGSLLTGRVLQVERRVRRQAERAADQDELTIVTDAGEIITTTLSDTTRVRIVDADLRQDVGRYLDVAGSNSDRSQRRVTMSTVGTGTRQLLVSYVGEAAVWKTTYRLIFPAGDRQPTLQGWALVDNVSAADWENVELSLVAGAPQAFRQPLSLPLFANRPMVPLAAAGGLAPQLHAGALSGGAARLVGVVRDEGGSVLPGVTVNVTGAANQIPMSVVTDENGRYEVGGLTPGSYTVRAQLAGFLTAEHRAVQTSPGATEQRDFRMSVGSLSESVTVTGAAPSAAPRSRANDGTAFKAVPPPPPAAAIAPERIEQGMLEQSIAASAAALGDLFEYRIADRVTVRRNQSALVPILQAPVKAERISLWNGAMGLRPRRAVWLANTSTLTLDGGSISMIDEGAFAGEGLIEPLEPGERRLVTYAADLALQVDAASRTTPTRILRLRAANGVVTQESEERWQRTYTIRNEDRTARTVVVEHPVRADWKLAGPAKPDESTPAVHRFRVSVPAGQTETLSVDEVKPGTATFAVEELHRDRLAVLVSGAESRAAVERAMQPVFEKSAALDVLESQMTALASERQQIAADQQRVRDNMRALGSSSAERRLRERYTRQLEEQENRVDAIERESAELLQRHTTTERELAELIAAVSFEVGA